MNLRLFTFFIALFVTITAFGQEKQLKVYLSQGQFYTPETGSYVEIGLNFFGYSLNLKTENGKTFSEVEITQVFSLNDSIIIADRYLLQSPEVIDSIVEDFYDIQRYPLMPGVYTYTLLIADVNAEKEPISATQTVEVKDFSGRLQLSTFMVGESILPNPEQQSIFTKIGYDVVPMFGNYYPEGLDNLLYYFEIYNADKFITDSIYVVEQKITGRSKKSVIDLEEYTRYSRYKTSPIQSVAKAIDIRNLPTGSYTLEIAILDRDKNTLAVHSFDFDRNNSDEVNESAYQNVVLDPHFQESIPLDSAAYYVASLIPISGPAEVRNILKILKEKDKEKNFKYLQAFWLNVNPQDPYGEWMRYKGQVQLVERLYSTNYQVGFETDRGRVYLQYGAPSSIIEEMSSPSEYPYEIWQYDRIGHYSNRRFIFYNPTNLNKDYVLLHSDMIGELQNSRWQYALNKRNTPGVDFDDPTGGTPSHFGGNSRRYFDSY